MSEAILLRPGQASLADWRAIYRGARIALDPVCRADVEAGSAALAAIVAAQDSASAETAAGGPAMVELLHKNGDYLPAAIVRLFVALKLASLAQGMSGVRWTLVERLAECLARDLLPAIPGANGNDRLALSHLFGALTGTGEVLSDTAGPAARTLRGAGLSPLKLNHEERSALLSGTQFSTALALAGLFEAERVLQSALVAAALSNAATAGPDPLAHPRVYKLRRHPGQIEVAAALRALLAGGGPGEAHAETAAPARSLPEMGACLDLLRQAGTTLERAANAVSEERLILWQTGEIVSGVEDAAPVSFAADLIAMALREIGNLAERRIAVLPAGADAAGDGLVAGAAAQLSMAASFNADNGGRPPPADGEGEPDAAPPPSAAGRARKLLSMAGSASLVIAIEFLAALRAGRPGEHTAAGLDKVRALLRDRVAQSGEIGVPAADLAAVAELVRSGALASAAGVELPSVAMPRLQPPPRRLGGNSARP